MTPEQVDMFSKALHMLVHSNCRMACTPEVFNQIGWKYGFQVARRYFIPINEDIAWILDSYRG